MKDALSRLAVWLLNKTMSSAQLVQLATNIFRDQKATFLKTVQQVETTIYYKKGKLRSVRKLKKKPDHYYNYIEDITNELTK